jgi:hypothetical protein
MFKEKSSKKRIHTSQNAKDASTLDAKHQNMIAQIAEKHNQLAELTQRHTELKNELTFYNNLIADMKARSLIDTSDYDLAWTSNLFIREQLKTLNNTIEYLRDSKDEIEYYENTAKILFQYYNLLENQVTNSKTQTISLAPVRATKGRKKLLPVATRSILEALQVSPTEASSEQQDSTTQHMPPPVTTQGLDKSSLVDEYMTVVDTGYVKRHSTEHLGICEECHIPLVCLQQDGIMVCSECGYQELLLVEQNRPILRQPSKEASHFSYKRINHFNSLEWNSRHEKCVTC